MEWRKFSLRVAGGRGGIGGLPSPRRRPWWAIQLADFGWPAYFRGMPLIVEIPDSVAEGLRLTDREAPSRLRCELAAALYQQELLAFGKAAELAGLSRDNFAAELGRRNISRHYSEEDASLDEAYAGCQ